MANYGLQATPGFTAFTGWTTVLGAGGKDGAASGSVYANGLTANDADIARILRNAGGGAVVNKVLLALLGAAAGGNATRTQARVKGSPQVYMGGAIPIETVTLVNRNTTAADLTAMQALVNRNVFPSTYAPDLSGNGGGGKGAW